MAEALPESPSGTSNSKEAARAAIAAVNVSLPAAVVSFDPETQTATVRIVPMFRRRDPNDKAGILVYAPPDIPGVPVAFPGTGEFSIFWPLEVGDSGRIVCCDRSIDEWKAQGGARTEPQDLRRHDLTDAVFVPDLRSPAVPIPADGIHATAMVIRANELRLGSSAATQAVALAPIVSTNLTTLSTAVDTALSAGAAAAGVTLPLISGAMGSFSSAFSSALALALAAWPVNMGASKVSAE